MASERTQALQAAQNLFKVPELKSKILFTLMALAVYRFGAHIPTAGVNLQALETLAGQFQGCLCVQSRYIAGDKLWRKYRRTCSGLASPLVHRLHI